MVCREAPRDLVVKIQDGLIDHDMGLVLEICDQLVVIEFGSVIGRGTPAEIRRNPDVVAGCEPGTLQSGQSGRQEARQRDCSATAGAR